MGAEDNALPKSDRDLAFDLLDTVIKDASQMFEAMQFRETHVADLMRLEPIIAKRWKREIIEKLEEGEEGDPLPTAEEFQDELTRGVFGELMLSANILNSSALVLCHSFLDDLLFDLLEIISLADHDTFHDSVLKKEVSIEDLERYGIDAVTRRAIQKHVASLKNVSISVKMDRIVAECSREFKRLYAGRSFKISHLKDYSYDKDLLERIDQALHVIVHEKGMANNIQEAIDDWLAYLWRTLMNAIKMVSTVFALPCDFSPAVVTRLAEHRMTISFKIADSSAEHSG